MRQPHDSTNGAGAPGWGRYRLTPWIAGLPGVVLKVTMALAEFASPERPWAWPRVATLAERLGIPEWKAREWLDKAEEAGVIEKCRRRFSHASLGYDLRTWFAAMGWTEARAVEPPQEARIVTAQGKAAVSTAQGKAAVSTAQGKAAVKRAGKSGAKGRGESLRATAREKPAASSEPPKRIEQCEADRQEQTLPPAAALPGPAPARSISPDNGNGREERPREGTLSDLRQVAVRSGVSGLVVRDLTEKHPDLTPVQIGAALSFFEAHKQEARSPNALFRSAFRVATKEPRIAASAE